MKKGTKSFLRMVVGSSILTILACELYANWAGAHTTRSKKQRDAFIAKNPCPSTGLTYGRCPGYEVDHIVPLACEGVIHTLSDDFNLDSPENMQWLTTEENRRKGSQGCRRGLTSITEDCIYIETTARQVPGERE